MNVSYSVLMSLFVVGHIDSFVLMVYTKCQLYVLLSLLKQLTIRS